MDHAGLPHVSLLYWPWVWSPWSPLYRNLVRSVLAASAGHGREGYCLQRRVALLVVRCGRDYTSFQVPHSPRL